MPFLKVNWFLRLPRPQPLCLLLCLSLAIGPAALRAEASSEKEGETSEAKAPAEKPAGPTIPTLPKDEKEYLEKTAKLTSLGNRIEDADRRFQEAIAKKSAAKGSDEKQKLIQTMIEITAQRNKDVEQFNKLKVEVGHRYPNKGEHLNRRYQTQNKRSVEEMEGVAGLDELLTRTKKIVERKFAPIMETEPPPGLEANPGKPRASRQTAPLAEEKPKRLRLEK